MFIVFEGTDGAGKSTQVDRFVDWLESRGHQVQQCADPGSTNLGNAIRSILLNRSELDISNRSEMLLFMAARAQMVAETIGPALNDGKIVVCDRFVLSTAVYQGYAGQIPVEEIWSVGSVATHSLTPDLQFVLDLPISELRARLGGNEDRMESRPDEYFEKVINGYREISEQLESAFSIDATQSMDAVHQQIILIAEARGL